ncbi:hypothetical protein [Halopseudomonas sp.]|uniref:hypothetical protein n=1 Tax=Halopseudomonas sp. TaxID=2901191 RepID=UPI0030018635
MRSSTASIFPYPRSILAVALAIGLTGCAGLPSSTDLTTQDTTRLQGEITSSSPLNISDGSHYQIFDLKLQQGDLVRVRVTGALEDAVLTLLDERGQLVNGPRQGGLHLAPEASGRYRLGVSGSADNGYGPFALELEKITPQNSGALVLDESIYGLLSPGQDANSYQLSVSEPGLYQISMSSDELDTVLKLSGGGLELENDDYGQSTDSQLVAQLQPGNYQVTATALDQPAEGTYDLQVSQRALPQGVELTNGGELSIGQTISGLADSSPRQYQLVVPERALLRVRMSSSEVDSYLTLQGSGVDVEDDDSGGDLDALITALVQPGTYRAGATTADGGAGLFELTSSLQPISGDGNRIRPGELIAGRITSEQGTQTTLVISEPGFYHVDLISADFDALLRLQGGGLDLEDDDGAGGTNSRIGRYLDAGTYQLISKDYDDRSNGTYVLSVELADEG